MVPPTDGGRMDDLRHFPHAPRDERAFGRNDSGFGPRDGGDEERGRERGRYNERDRGNQSTRRRKTVSLFLGVLQDYIVFYL
jgi:hypothetical protein